MERCFKIKEGSKEWIECLLYQKNAKKTNEIYGDFQKEFGIEATSYSPHTRQIWIEPTDSDMERFGKSLSTNATNGLRRFKGNSKPHKWWVNKLSEAGIKDTHKPFVPFWFGNVYGRSSTRLFTFDDAWYCSIESDNGAENETPESMIEVPRSEFYKIIEIIEARQEVANEI